MSLAGQREEIPAETPLEYSKLIESCWNQIPSARPAFGTIVENINKYGKLGDLRKNRN